MFTPQPSIRKAHKAVSTAIGGALLTFGLSGAPSVAVAENYYSTAGFLCCNMHEYGDWISDINYRYEGTKLIRAGSWTKAQGTGSTYMYVKFRGKKMTLGNDYSRDLSEREFLRRYIVKTDPREKIKRYDEFTRDAIRRLRVMPGMTEEQVLMSIGYPVSSYTPNLSSRKWQYWLDRSSQFNVHFDENREVKHVSGDWSIVSRVMYRPSRDVIKRAQTLLNSMGIDAGEPDGMYGRNTRRAVRTYQETVGLARNGMLDLPTLKKMRLGVEANTNQAPRVAASEALAPKPLRRKK